MTRSFVWENEELELWLMVEEKRTELVDTKEEKVNVLTAIRKKKTGIVGSFSMFSLCFLCLFLPLYFLYSFVLFFFFSRLSPHCSFIHVPSPCSLVFPLYALPSFLLFHPVAPFLHSNSLPFYRLSLQVARYEDCYT